MSDKEQIFSTLCMHHCSIMDGWVPYPSTVLSKQLGISLYKTRKYLKELKTEGLIDSDIYIENGWDKPIIVRGYVVTKMGRLTETFENAYQKERELCKECFGIDIGPSYIDLNEIGDEFNESA